MAALSALTPFGGETCNPADDAGPVSRGDCGDIRREGARYHLTYLNADYYRRLFHDRWIAQGCMGEVRNRMGYRFALIEATFGGRVAQRDTWPIEIAIRNEGWARLHNPRPLVVLLQAAKGGKVWRVPVVSAEPRAWLPETETRISARLTLPQDMPAGTYAVALALPDADASLANDPRYAIRFANADDAAGERRWDPALGAYRLGAMTVERR
jgi:hypothetical protein